MDKDKDIIVNTDTVAGILGYTRQRVNQLAKEGILEKKAPGRWPLLLNIKKYINYIRTTKIETDEQVNTMYWEEKALHEKAKREISELKLAKLVNRMHDAHDVETCLTGMLITFRNRILGMPSKLAPQLLGISNLAEIQELLDKELREILTELSEYDAAMFAGGEDIEEEDDEALSESVKIDSATTETNSEQMGR